MILGEVWTIDYFHIFIRLSLAAIFGGIIGFEREKSNHHAGFRTHILVSIGSALIMLISIYGFVDYLNEENVRFNPSRLAAQVITGIGFLGAGTILRHGSTVTGLTTVASLWVVAGIGLAIGAGLYFGAILSTLFVLISLTVLNKLEPYIIKRRRFVQVRINVIDKPGKLGKIASLLGKQNINVKGISILFTLRIPKSKEISFIVDDIKQDRWCKRSLYW